MKTTTSFQRHGMVTLIIMLLWAQSAYSQRPGRKAIRERIENQEIAFISREVNLTPEEAKAFWPVFDAYKEKKQQMNRAFKDTYSHKMEAPEALSDKEVKELIDSRLIHEQRLLDLKKEYHARYTSILPPRKVMKLYQAERRFKQKLLERLKERR